MSELDLDANVSDSALSSLESQYSPRQGSRKFDLDVVNVCRELRRLREENARLKAFAEAVVENFDCDCEELPPGETCFWCQAEEALPKPPEVEDGGRDMCVSHEGGVACGRPRDEHCEKKEIGSYWCGIRCEKAHHDFEPPEVG